MDVGQNQNGSQCTTHFRTYFSGWIGMFTGGTIWILTHGHLSEPHLADGEWLDLDLNPSF